MIGMKAGVFLCSLTCMVKMHQSDSCLKVQVPRPWLDSRTEGFLDVYPIQGCCRCTNSSLGSIPCHDSEKGVSISHHTVNIAIFYSKLWTVCSKLRTLCSKLWRLCSKLWTFVQNYEHLFEIMNIMFEIINIMFEIMKILFEIMNILFEIMLLISKCCLILRLKYLVTVDSSKKGKRKKSVQGKYLHFFPINQNFEKTLENWDKYHGL